MMDLEDELFTIMGEECSELIIAMSKIKRFGLDKKNEANLKQELGDVACMLALFVEHEYITEKELIKCADKKKTKLQKWSNLIPEEFVE